MWYYVYIQHNNIGLNQMCGIVKQIGLNVECGIVRQIGLNVECGAYHREKFMN